jgi:polar amino acid transport system substrate-binding protein
MTNPADSMDEGVVRDIAPAGLLRVALNMGNPILTSSFSTKVAPAGVTIDLSREFAQRLGIEAQFHEYKTAAEARTAVVNGVADIGFIAIDPERAAGIHFTSAYVEIVGSYIVPKDSAIQHNDEVDRPRISSRWPGFNRAQRSKFTHNSGSIVPPCSHNE